MSGFYEVRKGDTRATMRLRGDNATTRRVLNLLESGGHESREVAPEDAECLIAAQELGDGVEVGAAREYAAEEVRQP